MSPTKTAYMARPLVARLDALLCGNVEVLHPEQVVLWFEHGKSLDVGSLCYLSREMGARGGRKGVQGAGFKVAIESYDAARAEKIGRVIARIGQELQDGGLRSITVVNRWRSFIVFMGWADANGHSTALDGANATKAAVRDYAAYLRERVRAGAICQNTGAMETQAALSTVGDFLGIDDLAHGLNLLSISTRSKQATVPPCDDSQSKVLAMCETLFTGITSFLLENKPYPHRLPMPGYLTWCNEGLWVFPTTVWCMAPHDRSPCSASTRTSGWSLGAYDYANGCLRNSAEILKLARQPRPGRAESAFAQAARQLADANANSFHPHRQQLAKLAGGAFVLLFIAQTGMNLAEVLKLRWNDDYEVDAERQKFRAIKCRAGGRQVYFAIPVGFLPSFRLYLKLREYLVKGHSCELLFPRVTERARGHRVLAALFERLHRIDPRLPRVMSRQWRAAKSNWLIQNTDIATTALILQNSERTVAASYAAGSEAGHLDEMTNFLNQVSTVVVSAGQQIERGVDRAVGICTSAGEPNPVPGTSGFAPDCNGPEGCLFCDKFKVHADERDTRKLLSCQYCIRKTSPLFKSDERFQQTINPVLARIQQILDEVSRRDEPMVKRVTHEVLEDGKLDPYWESTMGMFMELGVV